MLVIPVYNEKLTNPPIHFSSICDYITHIHILAHTYIHRGTLLALQNTDTEGMIAPLAEFPSQVT